MNDRRVKKLNTFQIELTLSGPSGGGSLLRCRDKHLVIHDHMPGYHMATSWVYKVSIPVVCILTCV